MAAILAEMKVHSVTTAGNPGSAGNPVVPLASHSIYQQQLQQWELVMKELNQQEKIQVLLMIH